MQVFKLEGSAVCYLFVKPDECNWTIWSGLDGEKRYIKSRSSGQSCPAHQQNTNEWSFNKAGEDDKEEGGVVVSCTVHDQSTVK